MKTSIVFLIIFVTTLAHAGTAKKRAVSSVKEVKFATFSFIYDESETPQITFKNDKGEILGTYKSEHKLFMHDSVMAKVNGSEFLVTTWPNGNATYDVRVFLPVGNNKLFKGQRYVAQPLCDLGLRGDVLDLTTKDTKIVYNTVNGKPNFSVLVGNRGTLKYQSCP